MLRRQAEEHRKQLEVQNSTQSSEIQAAQEQMRMLQARLRQMEMAQEAENTHAKRKQKKDAKWKQQKRAKRKHKTSA